VNSCFKCGELLAKVLMFRPSKWVIRVGYGSGLSSVRVTFRSTLFGSGSGSVWVKLDFGSFSGQPCLGRIRFGLVRVKFELEPLMVTMFG